MAAAKARSPGTVALTFPVQTLTLLEIGWIKHKTMDFIHITV
jgi:hypothetical protein